ncbi:hypothetical protein [Xenorhabdus sp. IM139775]|uniref:hypothetical protein n=1 Tax=Xenorhabdus sp. IM139775 TaxID=3025876 RepID=UPI00235837C3|nr:hypothetical protein [Xenorhabdus sp. IM139775]MDC9592763.1 hypothetical protein [Xenorhabdus sp. IM139775]
MTTRNNDNFKRICAALELRRNDVFEILQEQYSKNQIDGWLRGVDSLKPSTGNSRATVRPLFRPMSDTQFDEFCEGLVDWLTG